MLIDEDRQQAIELYNEGATLKELALRYECNPETIKRRFVEWQVSFRKKNWFHKDRPKSQDHRERLRQQLARIRPLAIKAVKEGKRRSYKGKENPKWRGGSVNYFKQLVLARDGRKCRLCGYDEHPEIIEVDHLDGNHNNNVLENGMAVCPNCHRIEEFKRMSFHTKLRPKRYV